jgi:hypothetical protein
MHIFNLLHDIVKSIHSDHKRDFLYCSSFFPEWINLLITAIVLDHLVQLTFFKD